MVEKPYYQNAVWIGADAAFGHITLGGMHQNIQYFPHLHHQIIKLLNLENPCDILQPEEVSNKWPRKHLETIQSRKYKIENVVDMVKVNMCRAKSNEAQSKHNLQKGPNF